MLQARTYLDDLLDQYESLEELSLKNSSDSIWERTFTNEQRFGKCKIEGVGRDAIKSFLGEIYTTYQIQQALADLQ